MINVKDNVFYLDTAKTTYCLRVSPSGHLEHLYYGDKLSRQDDIGLFISRLRFVPGTSIAYSKEHGVSMDTLCLEVSSPGTGDFREPFAELTFADGVRTCDFRFQSFEILEDLPELDGLPSAYTEGGVETLKITLTDEKHAVLLELFYGVFSDCDVITRSSRIVNNSGAPVQLHRLLSSQLDLDRSDFRLVTFGGAWAREMNRTEHPCLTGMTVNCSRTGSSSNRANPFVMLCEEGCGETHGSCYGFNLVYSGNHFACAETDSFGHLRFLQGLSPYGFGWALEPGEHFSSPQAVMAFSSVGEHGISRSMHRFIREHIVRGYWKNRERPILVNSWESFYFNFNERKLLSLAKEAKRLGAELFVLDDGWFGHRDDDLTSLGDWTEYSKKLPDGLTGLSAKMKNIGIDLGIWVEPEMVNSDSALYREHPDWILGAAEQALGRNQLILDLGRAEVREYIIEAMCHVFSGGVTYVKWDMNRNMSDVFSRALPPNRQSEAAHRYILGLYEVLKALTERFPQILFEACASGGNRFDPGILCYMPQIWASDNTDVLCRSRIQSGLSFGYPQSVTGAHVSGCPNHQTLRTAPIDSRFSVAAFGLLGYELDLRELSAGDKAAVMDQISFYKKYRRTLQYGQLHRLKSPEGTVTLMAVSEDGDNAVCLFFSRENKANSGTVRLYPRGLDPEKVYHFTSRAVTASLSDFGGLVNMISPVHIKQGGIAEAIAEHFVKLGGETEDKTALGDTFMKAGIPLIPAFSGTGYDEGTRVMKDQDSRLYIWERCAD